jgi:hypothetical protein
MCRWTQEVLAAEEREAWADVLLFGEVAFEQLYEQASSLFTEAVWYHPGRKSAVRLFGEAPQEKERDDAGTAAAAGE